MTPGGNGGTPPFEDRDGHAVSAGCADAVVRFDSALDAYLEFRPDLLERVAEAVAADPGCLMIRVLRAALLLLACTPALARDADTDIAVARASAAERDATPRERNHLAAIEAWRDGDLQAAAGIWEAVLLAHPRDILALRLAHYAHFYGGNAAQLRDSAARVRPAWSDDDARHTHVLACHAFGLEESGDYAGAEAVGRAAVELDPRNIWAGHAVAHVMEMTGRVADGLAWIDAHRADWQRLNFFRRHLWWHQGLMLWQREDFDGVLALYDADVHDPDSDQYLDLCNDASLLWRLELAGVDVGPRWRVLADKAEAHLQDNVLAFIDAHYVMPLAALGREGPTSVLITAMGERAADEADPPSSQAAVIASVGLPLCGALYAFRNGNPGHAVDLLLPLRYGLRHIGGSHAQRDLFHMTLIAAALADGRLELARALLAERAALRPDCAWTRRRSAEVSNRIERDPPSGAHCGSPGRGVR